jgi:ubiquinone/menaquinone biosynthesis C-methylase UbiE
MKREIIDHHQKSWKDYDAWYDSHLALYETELRVLKKVISPGVGLEIGVGTGRFAAPLGLPFGVDPAMNMLKLAKKRGVRVVQGLGEELPFKDESFDFALIVFVLEFIDKRLIFLREAVRIIRPNGTLILGFIDGDSHWGRYYSRESSRRNHFFPPSARDIRDGLEKIGMEFQEAFQTLFEPPPDIRQTERPRRGFGKGGFVVIKAVKKR